MFNNVGARFALRAVLSGVAAANASLLTIAVSGISFTPTSFYVAALLGISTGLGYAGIGAAVPSVEPSIGNTPNAPPPAE